MCIDLTTEKWIETYYGCKERKNRTIHEAYDDMVNILLFHTCQHHDLYSGCNGFEKIHQKTHIYRAVANCLLAYL